MHKLAVGIRDAYMAPKPFSYYPRPWVAFQVPLPADHRYTQSHTGYHRALKDVELMEAVFLNTPLKNALLLSDMEKRSYEILSDNFEIKRNRREFSEMYSISYYQAKRLAELNLTHELLLELYAKRINDDKFDEDLHVRGINSPILRGLLLDQIKEMYHEDAVIIID